jgi:hypothetical protein
MDDVRVMGIIAIDATAIVQVALNVLIWNLHDLCFIAHHPYRLHSYNTINIGSCGTGIYYQIDGSNDLS